MMTRRKKPSLSESSSEGSDASAFSPAHNERGSPLARTAALLLALFLPACALSRYDQLQHKSGRVESSLKSEQARVLRLAPSDPERPARLDHLSALRLTLSAANIGLASVRYAVPHDQRDIAYDAIDEAYDTIDWNIPLGPADTKRPLPARFSTGALQLN